MIQGREQPGDIPDDRDMDRRREAALRDVLNLISRSRDDEAPVFAAMLNRLTDLSGADAAALNLARAGDTHQRGIAFFGVDPATTALFERGEVPMDPEVSSSAQAILTGKVIQIHDLMDTDSYRRGVAHVVSSVRDSGMRSIVSVPLLPPTGA
jgi:hypothetical protein